ncbi:MAG: DUF2934 domain-containing protein [Thermodesulfobacteriota bacterium]|jgi:hypothetical protein
MAEVSKLKIPKKRTKVDEKTLHQMSEKKAYEIYEQRGREPAKDFDDWLQAERILKGKKKS